MLRFIRSKGKHTATIWWVLIIVTVVTFLGGFVFLLGSGLNSSYQAKVSGAVGTVDGKPLSRIDYQNAIADQRQNYRRQYGFDPAERDLKMLEIQAWRSMVAQRLMDREARALGLKAYDRDVILSLTTNPPPSVLTAPSFQTEGKFDVKKYQAAITDPNNEGQVAALEEMTRRSIPVRKLQERLMTSVKLSQPELREMFRKRFEIAAATVVQVPADAQANLPAPSEADLERIYQLYRDRFTTGARTQVEVLMVPKKFGDEEVRTARELARGLADRARRGEDFAALARDYSEGPNAETGGTLDRAFRPAELGPELGGKIATLQVGGITDPIQDRSRFMIFKVLDQSPSPDGAPQVRLAEIMVRVRPNENGLTEQFDGLVKLRNRAAKIGLGKAAVSQGLATAMTGFFNGDNIPPELFDVPESADWSLNAKVGQVSPVFTGSDAFAVVQVAAQRPAGTPKREEIATQVRQVAEIDARVEHAKPRAQALVAALAQGRTLEQAAEAVGLTPIKIDGMSRLQPDQRLTTAPEVVGIIFSSPTGKVIGPIRRVDGWYFTRLDRLTPPDPTLLEQVKTQLTGELLQQRQQALIMGYASELRAKAKVKDLRSETGN
jgi:peptidyl-prolyl cis-trans isomerase D